MADDVKEVLFVKELIPSNIDATSINFSNLPETDPEVDGRLWSNGGVLTISSGEL
jgi:hypothetical protein